MQVEAFQVSELINLKKFRSEYTNSPLVSNNSELFYRRDENKFFYLFNYGVVVFAGFNDLEKSELLKFVRQYTELEVKREYREDFTVNIKEDTPIVFSYNDITLPAFTEDELRIIMLNIAQSVALDYYEDLSFDILSNTQKLTTELERTGSFSSPKRDLLKFVGRTLNIKNSIIDNLYIFDAPDIVWENETLSRIDEGLKRTFDLRMRYRDVDYKLKIVQENLTLFTDLLQNRESTRLEWVIIVLILIEVTHVLATWIF